MAKSWLPGFPRPLKMTLRSPSLWFLLAVALAPGCSRRPAKLPEPPAATATAAALQTIDPSRYQEILRNRRGRVVLVDFWATWCQPCLELFPHAVELQRRLGNRGLTVISFSLDDPDETEAVKVVLTRQAQDPGKLPQPRRRRIAVLQRPPNRRRRPAALEALRSSRQASQDLFRRRIADRRPQDRRRRRGTAERALGWGCVNLEPLHTLGAASRRVAAELPSPGT